VALPALPATTRKARLVRAFLARRPVHCTWQLSPRCESFCQFCDHRGDSAAEELDARGCGEVSDRLGRTDSLLVSFTGSDPFLRGDLAEIVAVVARRHFPLVVTNGWLVTPEGARAVWRAGLEAATVTLLDAEAARHDGLVGLPGAYRRAVDALETLSRERSRGSQRVNVRTRLEDGDASRLPALLALAARHGASVVLEAAYPLPVNGRGAGGLASRLREIRDRHPNLRVRGVGLDRIEKALEGGVPGCQAGRRFFNVDHRGRLSKCLEFQGEEDRVGSILSDGLTALLPRLRARHEANGCQACWYASRAEVEALYTVRGFVEGVAELVRS
jgi:MoaA/NifB/PqqE/SkfB family radical SAM enzyme